MSAQKYTPNQSEIDRCLEDAGVSDARLSYEEKLVFYEAIKVSEGIIGDVQSCVQETEIKKGENSADSDLVSSSDKEEDNWEPASVQRAPRRKQNLESRQQQIAPSKNKIRQKQNHPPETRTSSLSRKGPSSNSNDSQNHTNEPLRKADHSNPQNRNALKNKVSNNVIDLDGFDSPATPHSPLKLIKKSLAYEVPFLFSKTLNRMTFSEKVKAIYEHHVSLNEKYRQAQRRSRKFAKWGKPISSSNRFNGSLEKAPNQSQNETSDNETNSNISDLKEVAGSDNQRTEKSPSPNLQLFIETNDDSSVLLNTDPPPITDRNANRPVEISNESEDSYKLVSRNPNFDIIQDDLTETFSGRKSYSKNTSRSELLFESLVIEDRKKAQQKFAMQKFEQTLISFSDEEVEESKHKAESDEIVMVKQTRANEKGVRRRVSPPNPYVPKNKKNLRRRGKRGEDSKKVAAKRSKREHSDNSDDDFVKNHSKRRAQIIDVGETSPKDNRVQCPICNKLLPENKIQEHAEFCKTSDEEDSVLPAPSNTEILTCHVCDKVFRFNTEYEVHVKECIEEHMREK